MVCTSYVSSTELVTIVANSVEVQRIVNQWRVVILSLEVIMTDINIPEILATRCGGSLVLPLWTRSHLKAHPEALGLLEELAGLLDLPRDGGFVLRTVDFGRIIGRSGAVPTAEVGLDEPITFARRVGRDIPSRVEVGAIGPEVTTLVVVAGALKGREAEGVYTLFTSYAGEEPAPKEPTDPSLPRGAELDSALDWWRSHALCYQKGAGWETPFTSTWREVLGLE